MYFGIGPFTDLDLLTFDSPQRKQLQEEILLAASEFNLSDFPPWDEQTHSKMKYYTKSHIDKDL
jgi:hypothetical protein